jgi:hypothetical protein
MPAERADYFWIFPVENGDVIAKMMKQGGVMATVQHKFSACEHPFEYISECLWLAVARLLLFGHAFILAQKESPAGTITSRAR